MLKARLTPTLIGGATGVIDWTAGFGCLAHYSLADHDMLRT